MSRQRYKVSVTEIEMMIPVETTEQVEETVTIRVPNQEPEQLIVFKNVTTVEHQLQTRYEVVVHEPDGTHVATAITLTEDEGYDKGDAIVDKHREAVLANG